MKTIRDYILWQRDGSISLVALLSTYNNSIINQL